MKELTSVFHSTYGCLYKKGKRAQEGAMGTGKNYLFDGEKEKEALL
jgi:hypothetical protein